LEELLLLRGYLLLLLRLSIGLLLLSHREGIYSLWLLVGLHVLGHWLLRHWLLLVQAVERRLEAALGIHLGILTVLRGACIE